MQQVEQILEKQEIIMFSKDNLVPCTYCTIYNEVGFAFSYLRYYWLLVVFVALLLVLYRFIAFYCTLDYTVTV